MMASDTSAGVARIGAPPPNVSTARLTSNTGNSLTSSAAGFAKTMVASSGLFFLFMTEMQAASLPDASRVAAISDIEFRERSMSLGDSTSASVRSKRSAGDVESAANLFTTQIDRHRSLLLLDSLQDRAPDWAGPNTELPNRVVVARAKAMISQLPTRVPTPHISASADGAISFEWETPSIYIAAEMQSEGELVWIEKRYGVMINGDELEWTGKMPVELESVLVKTFA